MRRGLAALLVAVFVQGCSTAGRAGDGDVVPDAGTSQPDAGIPAESPLIHARPFGLTVPRGYAGQPTPLVVLLHGYGANGAGQAAYFGIDRLADERGFLLATPDGTVDQTGKRFWNADDACCDFFRTGVDDVAYVDAIIDDVARRYAVDAKRVYVVGHSNGAFMAHRYACERAGRVAAIASLAGAVWEDAARCQPGEKVSVLQIHGDADDTVRYDGGVFFAGNPPYPGAKQTVATWAAKNGCGAPLSATGATLDLDSMLPGSETVVERHEGCAAELWTIRGGGHIPVLSARFPGAVYDFLAAHPKP